MPDPKQRFLSFEEGITLVERRMDEIPEDTSRFDEIGH